MFQYCDLFYYRDTNNRSASSLGNCKRCPCSENALSCSLRNNGKISCNCHLFYDGDNCESTTTDKPRKSESPTVKPLEEKYTVVQNTNFSLTCESSKNPDETIVWTKIREDSLQRNCQQIGNILKIDSAQPSNRGIYQCRVTSNGQSIETSTIIEIERKICF